MQFENFDNKLRQAAEQHHPEYDEKAWAKMDKLLDKELPQKEDRRRRFIFFLLFLLIPATLIWVFITEPWKNANTSPKHKETTVSRNERTDAGPAGSAGELPSGTHPGPISDNSREDQIAGQSVVPDPGAPGSPSQPGASGKPGKRTVQREHSDAQAEMLVSNGSIIKKNKSVPRQDRNQQTNAKPEPDGGNGKAPPPGESRVDLKSEDSGERKIIEEQEATPVTETVATAVAVDSAVKGDSPASDKKTGKPAGRRRNSLFVSVSAGPDLSYVNMGKPGKLRLLAGAGIGYTVSRWTIRTGFYTAEKVYDAKATDYKPDQPVLYPEHLKNVAANCRVYEIPVSLAYNFGNSPGRGIFASAGLSSIIMRKEEYQYKYVYPSSPQPYYYTHVEDNKYKHLFSTVTLSAGYQFKVSRRFSAAVEPYIKMPLGGVGYGNVKLGGAGVLVSANVHLFK